MGSGFATLSVVVDPGLESVPEGVARAVDALDLASTRFDAGEVRSAADAALAAAEHARACGRPDLLAAAALVVDGVPTRMATAAVDSMASAALAFGAVFSPSVESRLHAQLSVVRHHQERFVEAMDELATAERLAAESGDAHAQASALQARLLAVAGLSRTDDILDLSERLLEAAIASDSFHVELMARNWMVEAHLRRGEPFQARHDIDALHVLAARTGNRLAVWNAHLSTAGLEHALGGFDAAMAAATRARGSLAEGDRPVAEIYYASQVMLVAMDRAAPPPDPELPRRIVIGVELIAHAMVGRYYVSVGDMTSARAAYDLVRSHLAEVPLDRRGLPILTGATVLAAAVGDDAGLRTIRSRLVAFEGVLIANALGAAGPVDHFLSVAELALGDLDAAVAHAQAAVETCARAGFGPWVARARLQLAEALQGRDAAKVATAAREQAELALAGADQFGMAAVRAGAERILVGLGARARLTPREREIAGLVADGATNREIARSLVLSERTVDTHVQNILAKLDFQSRTQIAAWAAAGGLSAGT